MATSFVHINVKAVKVSCSRANSRAAQRGRRSRDIITEARMEGQTAALTGTTAKTVAAVTPQRQPVPRFGGVSGTANTTKQPLLPNPTGTSKPLAIKWISPAKRQERLNKGLCFNCANQWTCGHKCLGKFLLLMTEEEDDMGVAIGDGGEDAGDVHVLIDNDSTYNFIRPDVVEKMCLAIKATKSFKVYIGSRESLLCESVCSSVTLHMQEVVMEVDLYVLPMQGPDVVLGIQWLQNLGKVTHDYVHQTIEFTLLDTTYSLKGDDSLRMKKISLHQMQAMLEHDDVYGVPTTLPPHRSIDHRIHLLLETKQALNAVTVKDKFPILTADEMFDELGGAIIFTKLDLRAGRGVEMDPKKAMGGYLQPLPMPEGVWEDVSMDFITGLPFSKGFTAILVVVDCFSKYAHFEALPTNFNGHKVAELFMEIVVKHHRIPKTIVSDRDPIFLSDTAAQAKFVGCQIANGGEGKSFYEPYEIVERIGKVAYRLALPVTSKIHPVFHVSILKLFIGTSSEMNGKYERQVLVQWAGRSPKEATCEWLTDFQSTYSTCNLEDKVVSEDGGNVTPLVGHLGCGKWTKKAPKWQESFVMG
ncbi:reverse transcriptase [Tanacetum coccineum]